MGWVQVDVNVTGDLVDDKDVRGKYEKAIREKVEQTIEEADQYKCNSLTTMWEGERVSSCTDCTVNAHI